MKKEWKKPKIEHNKLTEWNWMVSHPENLKLGKNVDIGAFTYIDAMYGVYIGNDVQIGGGCHIYSHNTIDDYQELTIIQSGAKIGAHSVLLPGVIIMKDWVIPAGSVIYKHYNMIRIKTPSIYDEHEIPENKNGCVHCFEDICLNQGFNIKRLEFFKHYLNECKYLEFNNQDECDMYE